MWIEWMPNTAQHYEYTGRSGREKPKELPNPVQVLSRLNRGNGRQPMGRTWQEAVAIYLNVFSQNLHSDSWDRESSPGRYSKPRRSQQLLTKVVFRGGGVEHLHDVVLGLLYHHVQPLTQVRGDHMHQTEPRHHSVAVLLHQLQNRVVLHKLTVTQLVNKFPEDSSPSLQDSATRPYTEPLESSSHIHTLIL